MRRLAATAFDLAVYTLALFLAGIMIHHLDEVSRIQTAESRYDSAEGRADAALKELLESLSLGWYEGAKRQREARDTLERMREQQAALAHEFALYLAATGVCFFLLHLTAAIAQSRSKPAHRDACPRRLIAHLLSAASLCLILSLVVPVLTVTVEKENVCSVFHRVIITICLHFFITNSKSSRRFCNLFF